MNIDRIIKKFESNNPGVKAKILEEAFLFAEEAHKGQMRKNGEPYIQHPLHTAYILAEIRADLPTVTAGILHDVPEDTERTLEDIEEKFGSEVASLVKGVTKLGKIKYRGIERYRENLKKMFLAMTSDLRVIFIKFCDRLNNLRTLDSLPEEKRRRIAAETLEIYAPIAGLLGIERLKWQMEDICFKYLYPEKFNELEYRYEVEKKLERQRFLQKVKKILIPKLDEANIEYQIEARFKHLYSIFKKMQEKDRKFNEIYDVFALRVIVPSIDNCYKVLGVIHTIWKPKPNRFKDYIAVPKPNGYRSLHTTIFGPEGKPTEFQIRTKEMHEEALYGIAAHWYYKAKNSSEYQQPYWVQEIVDIQKEITNTSELVKNIKMDIFRDRIFVFSPRGDVFELPEKSTPIDFAYAVHGNIGNKASGVLVNDKLGRLDQELKNGDMVEIIVEKNRQHPSKDWLKFVKTKRARDQIKQHAKKSTIENIKRLLPGTREDGKK
ncbi:MAG: RelA/SpoT family protein [Patescibacteria group bacterium]|jgi:guanosine-3',5'-bis(diphosphate) 3'-pyrophosphohydrolase|nr:RelA/SpoT family protein [Patescibacteria group bacterium]MDD3778019.1 RelA/SpoT family protein [Patescibacteria group bacterium]MDD3939128.1 RelA/SpoT family protein [Patescibacteria group bacterium]MDD4443701.1 RelA/SpoT family protein [Patescibacteria group bacterium]NCU39413.1 bifunctional (p)ppGpp synthetase/guanosine-3',5'-bis(diphosphate) 3'-pyrophosphohydrolase [Candidatus Falkowbacteria bacterium]